MSSFIFKKVLQNFYIIVIVTFCAVFLIGNITVMILPLLNGCFRVPIYLTIIVIGVNVLRILEM